MALDDLAVLAVLVVFYLLVPVLAVYGLYRLTQFLKKVDRFIDQQDREVNSPEARNEQ